MNISKASVSKQVSRLEDHLGVRLLNRTTRRLSLTEAGTGYLERVRRIITDVEETEDLISQRHTTPSGTLRINAPMTFGVMHLAPALPDFMRAFPDITIELDLNDRQVDVVDEGYDMAVRIAQLADSSLIARRFAPCRLSLCAAPTYWAKYGKPETPDDLANHPCLIYTYNATPGLWRFVGPDGPVTVKVDGKLHTNNGQVLCEAAQAGVGVYMAPTFITGDAMRDGSLEPALVDWCNEEIGMYVVYPHNRHLSAKVRAFVDFLVGYFGPAPSWDR